MHPLRLRKPLLLAATLLLPPGGLTAVTVACSSPQAAATAFPQVRWEQDGVPVVREADEQSAVQVARDGHGGAVIVWQDRRPGVGFEIYAQRLDSDGRLLWAASGQLVGGGPGDQKFPVIAPDDAGGAWIAWTDYRSSLSRVRVQHLASNGAPSPGIWPADGLELFSGRNGHLWDPRLVSDGTGGAYLVAMDHLFENGLTMRLTCSRFLPGGSNYPGWPATGVTLGTAAEWINPDVSAGEIFQIGASIAALGMGVVVNFTERTFSTSSRGGFSRSVHQIASIGPTGNVQWTTDPDRSLYAIINAPSFSVPNGAGGAILIRHNQDYFRATTFQSNGLSDPTIDFGHSMYVPALLNAVADGQDGAFAFWQALNTTGSNDYWMARIDHGGRIPEGWPTAGIKIVSGSWFRSGQRTIADGAGGVLVCWEDQREQNKDLYLLRLASDGSLIHGWKQNGLPLVTIPADQFGASMAMITSHTAVIAWVDGRSGSPDVYAQSIQLDALEANTPSPAEPRAIGDPTEFELQLTPVSVDGKLRLSLMASDSGPIEVSVHDIHGRVIQRQTVSSRTHGSTHLEFDFSMFAPGVYWARAQQSSRLIQRRVVTLR